MKSKHILTGITAVGMAASALGADEVTMYWGFETGDNPATAQRAEPDPMPATGVATITVGFAEGYFPGTVAIPGLSTGTATGVWDIAGGVKMDINLFAATPQTLLDYTVVVNQFASGGLSPGFPWSPAVQWSLPGAQLVSQVDKEVVPGSTGGTWIESTYTWQSVPGNGPITLTMSSDPGRGLLLDSLEFSVLGDLSPIPEPSVSQLGALAALMLGIGAFRRSKTTA